MLKREWPCDEISLPVFVVHKTRQPIRNVAETAQPIQQTFAAGISDIPSPEDYSRIDSEPLVSYERIMEGVYSSFP